MAEKETPDLLPALMHKRALREPGFAKLVVELAATLAESNKQYRGILHKRLSVTESPRSRGRSPNSPGLKAQLAAEREVFTKHQGMTATQADELSAKLHNLSPSRIRALAAEGRKLKPR